MANDGSSPYGPYFVFPFTGTIQRQSNPLFATGLITAGWVGFKTMNDAENYAHKHSIAHDADVAGKVISGDYNSVISTWLVRIGEIALGIVLLAVGIAQLTGVENKIGKLVKAVPIPV